MAWAGPLQGHMETPELVDCLHMWPQHPHAVALDDAASGPSGHTLEGSQALGTRTISAADRGGTQHHTLPPSCKRANPSNAQPLPAGSPLPTQTIVKEGKVGGALHKIAGGEGGGGGGGWARARTKQPRRTAPVWDSW